MANGIYTEIKKRIELAEPGSVFLTSDFTDIATTTTVRKCLGRQVEEKSIRRIMDGVYEKPVYSKLLKEYIPANPDAIAYAIARRFRWSIAPCGDVACWTICFMIVSIRMHLFSKVVQVYLNRTMLLKDFPRI